MRAQKKPARPSAPRRPAALVKPPWAQAHLQQAVWAVLDKARGNINALKVLGHLTEALAAAVEGAEKHASPTCLVSIENKISFYNVPFV